jgi:hypothetical protein
LHFWFLASLKRVTTEPQRLNRKDTKVRAFVVHARFLFFVVQSFEFSLGVFVVQKLNCAVIFAKRAGMNVCGVSQFAPYVFRYVSVVLELVML